MSSTPTQPESTGVERFTWEACELVSNSTEEGAELGEYVRFEDYQAELEKVREERDALGKKPDDPSFEGIGAVYTINGQRFVAAIDLEQERDLHGQAERELLDRAEAAEKQLGEVREIAARWKAGMEWKVRQLLEARRFLEESAEGYAEETGIPSAYRDAIARLALLATPGDGEHEANELLSEAGGVDGRATPGASEWPEVTLYRSAHFDGPPSTDATLFDADRLSRRYVPAPEGGSDER